MKGILAILMAGMMVLAIAVPMAMGDDDPVADTSVTIGNAPPGVCAKWEEPDDQPETPDTTEVMPEQHPATKTVTIKACVCDPNGEADIDSVMADVTGPTGFTAVAVTLTRNTSMDCSAYTCPTGGVDCIGYDGTFAMGSCDPAGMYTVIVTVTDQIGATDTDTNHFEYLSLIAMTAGNVAFGSVAPGESNTSSSTITVYGNDAIKFVDVDPAGYDDPDPNDGIVWSDMISGGNTIPDTNIITTWDPSVCILGCLGTDDVPFTLTVPPGTLPGTYAGTITFTPSHC
jgi:hypothetical protein